jgi:E3 ubiquitin-protein ligase MYCBP2
VDADDFCQICWTENLASGPCLQMQCGTELMQRRWPGPEIKFGFMDCPCCKAELVHPSLEGVMEPIRLMKEDVSRKALMRLEFENKHKDAEVTDKDSKYFEDPTAYAMHKYNYYQCFKCSKPYFGGEAVCGGAAQDTFNAEELICPGCAAGDAAQICPKHGTDFLEYKCRYCEPANQPTSLGGARVLALTLSVPECMRTRVCVTPQAAR